MQRLRKSFGLWVVIGFFASLVLFGCDKDDDSEDTVTDNPPVVSQVGSSVFSDTDNVYPTDRVVRIDVEESSGATDINSGTIRITSASQGYDSGVQDLTFGSIFYHWDTTDLNPASDYVVEVTLTDAAGQTTTDNSLVVTLTPNPPAINKLVSEVDISVSAQGLPVRVVRTYLLDSGFDSTLGFGWTHTYLMHVVETGDGLVKVFNADGSGSFFERNGDGTYDPPKGEFRTLSKASAGTFELRAKSGTRFHFNAAGKLTSIEDRHGNVLNLNYNAEGFLDTITDASGQSTTFAYDGNNRISSVTDPAGRSVSYGYDNAGNLTSVTNISGFETAYSYDGDHNLTTLTDPAGHRTFFTVDALNRLESISQEGGANSLTYQYEVPSPNQMTVTDAPGNETIWTYDNNGSVTAITDPLGNTTVRTYDSSQNLISETDANGHQTEYTYDGSGNILSITDALGNVVSFTYDPMFNQVASLADGKGNTTTYDYDNGGNLIAVTYPDGSGETFTYDVTGNRVSNTDRNGHTIGFEYDFQGGLTAKLFPDGTSDTFNYDEAGNLISARDENGTISVTYDSMDRVIQVTDQTGETVSYTYDETGNRTQLTYPDGSVVDYGYDDVHRLTEISRSGEVIASYSYDLLSRRIQRDLLNGTFTTYVYDQAGRLLKLVNAKSDSEVISNFSYSYDNVGNRLTMTTLEGTTQYTYDAINQLVEVLRPDGSTTTYDFDSAGNRISVMADGDTTDYTANERNQYANVGDASYTYDANGNMTSKTTPAGTTTYAYDFENRLTEIIAPTETITFTYNPFGRRSSMSTSYGTTQYIYSGGNVIIETDDAGIVEATYVYGSRVDEVLVMRRGGIDYFYTEDGLGSVTDLTDEFENVVESYSYDAYGVSGDSSLVGNPYRFTGRRTDQETGMYYFRARYYDSQLGRFVSEDPIGIYGGPNLYTYVQNNPINLVDPFGLAPHDSGLVCAQCRWRCVIICWFDPLNLPFGPCQTCQRACDEICGGGVRRGDPTFIQVSRRPVKKSVHAGSFSKHDGLVAMISVPCEDSLVRANVPIFGQAHGKAFKEYRVEYGAGENPSEWFLIYTSTKTQRKEITSDDLDDASDLTLHGNIATWDTGLKNYVYLPSHPQDHPIDLKGTYTIRLVVTGNDGSTVEDRVTVNVANVIPNAWGGQVTSKDGRVVLTVPEQAIMDSFRLILIEAAKNERFSSPSERQVIGNIYEVREPGEQFTKEALLQIAYSRDEISVTNLNQLGIYGYNSKTKTWKYIDSKRDESRNTVIARVRKLHPYYALMTSDLTGEGSALAPALQERSHIQQVSTVAFHGHNLVRNTFEDGLGEWSNRDNEVGATVTLDNTATFDETHAVKITNTHMGGNFAVNVITTPFDVKDYPLVQFDYRIPPEVKTNILVKVSGRWYDIGFTDDPKELKDKRVNIAHIGDINDIVADDQWHTARFNLYDMLRTKTGNARAEAMIMADWDVGGYMKLQFGKNAKDATYYIDNFTISREIVADLRIDSDILLVDNFNQKKTTNALGGATTIFSNGKKERLETTFSKKDAGGKGHALALSYDVSDPGSYTGYVTGLQNLDLRGYQSITFFIKGTEVGQDLQVGLKDASDHESKVIVSHYLPKKMETTWQKVTIPLVAFSCVKDWGKLKNLSFSIENGLHGKGVVFVDNIEFQKEIKSFMVDNFERLDKRNSVGREQYTFVNGAAAINGQHAKGSPNGIYRLSYGGNIGVINAYASDLKSYAGWTTKLGGIDCSQCGTLSFDIRGAKGGENASLYLADGNFRWGADVAKYAKVTTSWQRVIIPLREFADYGTDLTHLAELQFVFEGEKMSGTIYLDDICFGHEGN